MRLSGGSGRQPRGYGAGFFFRQMLDGGGHDAARVVTALAGLPAVDLLQGVGGRLAADRGLAFARALSLDAVTAGAGDDAPCRVPC